MITESKTVHVVIGWNDEDDSPWIGMAQEGDAEESSEQFEADIPWAMWDRIERAGAEMNAAFEAAAEVADYDSELARMKFCCPEWQGHTSPSLTSWAIIVPASGNDKNWPLHDHAIGYERSEEDAVAKLAALPDEFTIIHAGFFSSLICRDSLTIQRNHHVSHDSACCRCGWSRSEHAKPGALIDG